MDARSTDPEPGQLSHAEIRTILIGVMLAMFLSALEQTIVASALPTIGLAFGDMENVPWIVTSYLLTGTAVTPLVGKLADIHGPRPILLGSISLFIGGSVLCALAPSMIWLVLGRAVQGLGGGGLIALAQTIIGLIVAPKERGRYQAFFAVVFITSSVAGPVLGGFFAEHLHWSLIFWINVPLGLAAAYMSDSVLHRLPAHHHPHRLDIVGALLLCAAAMALMLALSWGGQVYAWSSAMVLGLLAGSLLLWCLLGLRLATAREPLIPLSILFNRVVGPGVLAAAMAIGSMIGLSVELPFYFEGVLGFTASQSGGALIPLLAGVVVGATGTGRMMGLMHHYKRVPLIGVSSAVVALALLALFPRDVSFAGLAVLMAITGAGLGTVLPVVTVSVQNAVPLPQIGTATGVQNFFRSLGGVVLAAAFGAIVLGASGMTGHQLLEGFRLGTVDAGALTQSFRFVFAAAALALAIGLVGLIFMEERPLRSHSGPAPID
ncbi:EmrB/QacA subfamily drug resistance transporter [Ancylobacter sp. 3268]|uniref:MDR family MFS transporter n=1 Tax=Ancylobacter sp. 3268 TaxID=2817752 RepID=UPI00285B96B6|nr:MDR family MFS transporter [Ancylobacter sp. 3268]MDR6950744.1 EmrB/QacA subfamily drug resistance transporter [Ancylobacter sp. 3268]